ncbi:hypothetical protein SPONN_2299 [uncultured Candidatus Thioglobus sp.]|nr:hypothetical protein SPONN_2299 [uncultured Candidatus Thioglobus sp.]
MNEILNQLIEEQTPEQMRQAFAKIREERGYCPNDMSVEEALGISIESSIDFQYANVKISTAVSNTIYQKMGEITNYSSINKNVENIHTKTLPCLDVKDIFNQTSVNDTSYPLAA